MRAMLLGCAILCAALSGGNAAAMGSCVRDDDISVFMVAELQQQLMVAAYTCHEERAYNRFVLSNRRSLQRSDHAMLALFNRLDGTAGFDRYNSFKTKLANLSALRSNENTGEFCAHALHEFHAFAHHGSLIRLARLEPAYAELPFETCN